MQAILRIRQARPRVHRLERICQRVRQLGAVALELLALVSLATALAAGLLILSGLPA